MDDWVWSPTDCTLLSSLNSHSAFHVEKAHAITKRHDSMIITNQTKTEKQCINYIIQAKLVLNSMDSKQVASISPHMCKVQHLLRMGYTNRFLQNISPPSISLMWIVIMMRGKNVAPKMQTHFSNSQWKMKIFSSNHLESPWWTSS